MPKLTVNGVTANVEKGKRLVLAIEKAGINIGHRCGGIAKCTTCRVNFISGEPDTMTAAEFELLEAEDLVGEVRLSCQMTCEHDMEVEAIFLLESEPDWDNTGQTPKKNITPDPEWIEKP